MFISFSLVPVSGKKVRGLYRKHLFAVNNYFGASLKMDYPGLVIAAGARLSLGKNAPPAFAIL